MSKTGFLHAEGKKFIDRNGNEIQLRGVALGNWLLLEGYMWGFMTTACNREWLIQDAFRQLAGPEEAEKFFPAYRDAFITETDIRMIAEMGFNSIRIPILTGSTSCTKARASALKRKASSCSTA